MLDSGKKYKMFIKKGNPILPIFNFSDDKVKGETSSCTTKIRLVNSTEDILRLLDDDESEDQGKEEDQILSYDEAALKKISLMDSVLSLRGKPIKVVSVIGERKTGKSSLSYLLANRLLEHSEGEVFFFETDLGQPSICPPGFMAIRKLNAPILKNRSGWTREYRSDDLLSFVGDYSPEFNTETFIRSFVSLLSKFKTIYGQTQGTMIINTHGYLEESGRHLMRMMIEAMNPDILFVINFKIENIMKHLRLDLKTKELKEGGVVKQGFLPFIQLGQLTPSFVKDRSRMVKISRDVSTLKFFEESSRQAEIPLANVDFEIIEDDEVKQIKDGYDFTTIALTFINSIGEIRFGNQVSFGLSSDYDLSKQSMILEVPEQIFKNLTEYIASGGRVYFRKSSCLGINHTLLDSFNNYKEELAEFGSIGNKLYWASLGMAGVGSKPAKKIVSVRKRLKTG